HPGADVARGALIPATTQPTAANAADEVVDLALGNQLLELGQRRCGIRSVEAADRHHRDLGRDLHRRSAVGRDRRRRPGVALRTLLEQRDQVARHLADAATAEESAAAHPTAAGGSTWTGARGAVRRTGAGG